MFFTAIARPTPSCPRIVRLLAGALLLAASFIGPRAVHAAVANTVPWHADLAEAQRAAQISGRPVLAIFTASWMASASAIDRTALASDEAVAVVTACYEAVCVDVDANPEATRRVGVSRVPTACVLTADNCLLAKFELPGTPAEFVAVAARAAQDAAFATATARPLPRGVAVEHVPGGLTRLAGRGSAFGGQEGFESRPLNSGMPRGIVPPGGRAITAVAAKVRMLSDFASDDCPPTASGDAIAASFRETRLPTTTAAADTPTGPTASMPANTAVASSPAGGTELPPGGGTTLTTPPSESLAGSTPPGPLGVDTGAAVPPTTQPGGAAPWLGMPQAAPAIAPAAPAQPPLGPAAAADVATAQAAPATKAPAIEPRQSDAQKIPSATDTAAGSPPAPSAGSSLLATLQKPFGMFARPAAPKTDSPEAGASSTEPQKTAAAPAADPDLYGSMPVGLEGYCPVMLAERGLWVEGRAQWGVRHRGRTYLFAGEQQQQAFLADPDRYAPALSGDDPVLAFDSGKSTPGQRRYGVTYQSRMYLFSSSQTRDTFAANPQRYTAGTFVAESRGSAGGGSVVR